MDAATAKRHVPPPDFVGKSKDPVLDLTLNDSTEIWLIQWPANQPLDVEEQELSLSLHNDGELCSFEGSSEKVYDMVSFASQEPDATVIRYSASESKGDMKISRRVSLVQYADPNKIEKEKAENLKGKFQRSSGTSLTHSSNHLSTPSRSSKPSKSSMSASRTHGSRHKGSTSKARESSKSAKKRQDEPSRSMAHSGQDSGRGNSAQDSGRQSGVTSTGSMHSHGKNTHTSSGSFDNSHRKKKPKTKE